MNRKSDKCMLNGCGLVWQVWGLLAVALVDLTTAHDNAPQIFNAEAAKLKERVGLLYNPLVYGRVCELLDGAPTDSDA
jgi:hypothetical protein